MSKWETWMANRASCQNCWDCKWMHDGPTGECLGANAGHFDAEGKHIEGRAGCKKNCPGFTPFPDNLEDPKWSFRISGLEAFKASQWLKEHDCPQRGQYSGAIGGTTSYEFTSTGLGDVVVVHCWCGQEANITDFSSW